jgi:hypothetical protein
MTTKAVKTRDRFFDAINETYDALLTGFEATEERGHRVSRTLLSEARQGEKELSTLARTWVDSPRSVFENLGAMIDAQARAQRRAVELARDSLKGAGAYGEEVRKALRRMIRSNRAVTDAVTEVARSATSRAAQRAEHLPLRLPLALPRRARPARPARIAVVEGDIAETKAG